MKRLIVTQRVTKVTQRTLLAAGLVLACAGATVAPATDDEPFANLEGHWQGNGTIELANGAREPIKCRANYDLPKQNNLQLDVRCASDSYQFDLRASANYANGAISGNWSESTRNAAGTISGTADKERFEVLAKGPAFSATLTMATKGDKQTIDIQSQDQKTTVKGASISLEQH